LCQNCIVTQKTHYLFLTSILIYSSGKDYQSQTASVVLPSDAIYKLRQKLHQTGNSVEVTQNENCIEYNISAKSGTEPGAKSNDDSWVGDGAGLEFAIHALDGEGSAVGEDVLETKSKVNSRSLARKQRRDQRKKDAREAAALLQQSINDVEMCQNEIIVKNDINLSDILLEDKLIEGPLDGCIVIQPMPDETIALPPMIKNGKQIHCTTCDDGANKNSSSIPTRPSKSLILPIFNAVQSFM